MSLVVRKVANEAELELQKVAVETRSSMQSSQVEPDVQLPKAQGGPSTASMTLFWSLLFLVLAFLSYLESSLKA